MDFLAEVPDLGAGSLARPYSLRTGVIVALIFIIIAAVAVAAVRRGEKSGASRERFGWADWAGTTERENFAISGAAPPPREGFSPDAPGACGRKFSRAARAELDALRVTAGM